MKENKKINVVVNILLAVMVLAFVFGCIYIAIRTDSENNDIYKLEYNEEIIKKIMNEQEEYISEEI